MALVNVKNRGMRLPMIGKIRKGKQVPVIDRNTNKPKQNGAGEIIMRPIELPYWVFNTDTSQEEEVNQALMNAYGTLEIKALNVFLAYPQPEKSWDMWLEAYNYQTMVARTDERNVVYLYDTETHETLIKDSVVVAHSKKDTTAGNLVKDIPIGGMLPYAEGMVVGVTKSAKPILFDAIGRLTVVIPEIGKLGTWTVSTGGYWYDFPVIDSAVEIVKQICEVTHRPANTIPMVLRRVEREHKYTDEQTGEIKKKVGYDISLEVRGDITKGLMETWQGSPFAMQLEQHSHPMLPDVIPNLREERYDDGVPELSEPDEILEGAYTNAPISTPLPSEHTGETTDPFTQKNVEYAAKKWGVDKYEAAKQMGKNPDVFFKGMLLKAFRDAVNG